MENVFSIPSWASTHSAARDDRRTVCEEFVAFLHRLGVRHAFGVIGGALAPFSKAIEDSSIEFVHCRHEAGAAFSALESSLHTGRLTVVFATTGPGLINALNGLMAARWDGGRVVLVSAGTTPEQRGRWAAQETSAYTLPTESLFTSGPLFHYATRVESPVELAQVASRIAAGSQRLGGFVAHVNLPLSIQATPALPIKPMVRQIVSPAAKASDVDTCVELLSDDDFVIWLGHGARHASVEIRHLVEKAGAFVMSSPRAKGIFPEDHPQYLGVTGLGGHAQVIDYLSRHQPRHILVLGSRLGESTSYWARELIPSQSFIHVDVDASVFGAAYPTENTLGIVADIQSFVRALVDKWPNRPPRSHSHANIKLMQSEAADRPGQGICPVRLMAAVQEVVVDNSQAVVMAESGNAFAWATHYLRFSTPNRYRISPHYGSMSHVATGVVGLAMVSGQKSVAIVGDGSMLMLSEISTAVQYDSKAVWIILNDSLYGMCSQGMKSLGWKPFQMEFPTVDFVRFAEAMGAKGVSVDNEANLHAALHWAMTHPGPCVVDVHIDPKKIAPACKRNQNLRSQGVANS